MTSTDGLGVARTEQDVVGLRQEVAELRRTNGALRTSLRELVGEAAALRASGDEFHGVVESMPQIVWITRPDGWHVNFNQQWMDFTGLTLAESLGHGWNPPFHPDDRGRAAARWREATETGRPYEIEYRLRRADGVYHWMLGRAVPLRDPSGSIVKWFGTCTDIQQLKQAEERMVEQARLLDETQDAVLVLDLHQRVRYWNRGAERIHGRRADDALGRQLSACGCISADRVDRAFDEVMKVGEWSGELQFTSRTGTRLDMEGRWRLLRDGDGSPRSVLAVHTDVTERKATEAAFLRALEVRATHDPLTGLANRALLFDRLELLLEQRHGDGLAVAFLDLDDFKGVNDRFGHRVGDLVLVHVADRLRDCIRKGDVAARLGGDEFVVVGAAADEQAASLLGARLAAVVCGTVVCDGTPVRISTSVGVAFSPRSELLDADALVSSADAAMYARKRRRAGHPPEEPATLPRQASGSSSS